MELFAQHLGHSFSVGAHLILRLYHESRFHGGDYYLLACLRHVGEQVVQEAHPAALPGAALQNLLDRRPQPQVGIRDHQPGAFQAPSLIEPRI